MLNQKTRKRKINDANAQVLQDTVFPYLFAQGWIRAPFESRWFGRDRASYQFDLLSVSDSGFLETMSFYLTSIGPKSSGFPNIQIDFARFRFFNPEGDNLEFDRSNGAGFRQIPVIYRNIEIDDGNNFLFFHTAKRFTVGKPKMQEELDKKKLELGGKMVQRFSDMRPIREKFDKNFELLLIDKNGFVVEEES